MVTNYHVRLEENSDFIIVAFSGGNREVNAILNSSFQLHFAPEDLSHIFYLYVLGITGDKFLNLWNKYCNMNKEKLFEAIDFFRTQSFSTNEILSFIESPKTFI